MVDFIKVWDNAIINTNSNLEFPFDTELDTYNFYAILNNNPKNIDTHNKIRKLSVTISLSNPEDYEGGELEFDLRNSPDGKPNIIKCKEILPRGSIVVFPSHVWHRVAPVTKGTRYSLVIWSLGYPFK
jgi:predicted 2-oxoglutarate/Fe(II)-dependent dioxygenase YbiX